MTDSFAPRIAKDKNFQNSTNINLINSSTETKIIEKNLTELNSFFTKNKFKQTDCVVLEKNENSFLVPFAKECTKEFFRGIFSTNTGPFWEANLEMGLSANPSEKEYALFICDQIYFCKNIEEEYLYSIGPKISYIYKNEKLTQKKNLSFDSLMRTFSAPFDIISKTNQTILDAFKINEILPEIKIQLEESKNYWEKNKDKNDFDANDAEYALEKAIKSMKYSFLVSLAYSLKLKPSEQINPLIEETKQIYTSIKNFQTETLSQSEIDYFGKNIYDISQPRLFDSPKSTTAFESPELPLNEWMILREALKIVCARYLAVQRKAYLSLGKKLSLNENIFYLSTKEINQISLTPQKELVNIIAQRKFDFQENSKNPLPNKIIYSKQWFFEKTPKQNSTTFEEIKGLNVGAKKTVRGFASFVRNDEDLKKDFTNKIIVTSYFSPNLVITYKSALGVISSVGGSLSHPAIVAREKNLPCIVQAQIEQIKEGDEIELNGEKGIAKIVEKN